MSSQEPVHLGEQQLDDYSDGTLGDVERAIAERHLAACDTCRRAVDETRVVLAWATGERAAVQGGELLLNKLRCEPRLKRVQAV